MGNIDKSLAIFGCSDVFGHGLDPEHTISHLLSEKLNYSKVTNYGRPGSGTNFFLYKLEKLIEKGIISTQEQGHILYVLAEGHVSRANNDFKLYPLFNAPVYDFNPSTPKFDGFIQDKFFYRVIKRVYSSRAMELINYDPLDYNLEKKVKNTCKLLNRAKVLIEQNLKNQKFLVIIHPNTGYKVRDKIINCMSSMNIAYLNLNYSNSSNLYEYEFEMDEHPTLEANQYISKEILKAISQ
ncbi:hypothetical protein [Halobacteriovorax sp. HLS]|uniref:hypothetical protein n=1 Tax=Halobacteriovorax sp. HLS TaxID=2234000 RepID=UPI000FD7E5A5|nr:hypothetical protein [Halobacteriovorax sp. HLS]